MNGYSPEQFSKKAVINYKVSELKDAMDNGKILEALVIRCNKDLTIEVKLASNLSGTMTIDEFEYSPDEKPIKSIAVLAKVGKTIKFKVLSMEKADKGYNITLSRKAAQRDCYENYVSKFEIGQVIDAMATYVESYGIFCDIGCGIPALMPIENVCTTRINNPKESLKGVHHMKAVVKSVENGKITLSHKELLGTWEDEAAKFELGDTVSGIVRIVEDYGVFVQLTPNLVGLADVYPDVNCGDSVSVYIKNIVPDKMKIKLMIISKNDKFDERIHFEYKLPESGFIRDWVYSPDNASKRIESHF